MGAGFISKWAVRQDHAASPDDLGAGGTVRDEVLERWVAAACSTYLEGCTVLQAERERDGLALRHRARTRRAGDRLGRPDRVVVTARATEVGPRSFVVAVRLRGLGEERDLAVDVPCEVWLEDPAAGEPREVGSAVRDELISIEHAASHYN